MVINIAKIAHLCETMEISSQKVADICPNFHRAFLPWRRLAPKKLQTSARSVFRAMFIAFRSSSYYELE